MTADRLEYNKFQIKPRSYEFYGTYIRLYVVPHIGMKKFDKLTTPDVRPLLLEVKATLNPSHPLRLIRNYVRQSLITVNHAYALSTPKTQRGIRRVVIDPETLALLETRRYLQLEEQRNAGEGWSAPSSEYDDLIFTTELGGPIHPRNFDRVWYSLLEEAKVSKIRFHDLRHMHVSLLHKAGVELRAISDRIGHTYPSFTMKRYAHVIDDQRRAAAIPVLELLSPRSPKPN